MEFERLAIKDLILVKPKIYEDERGYFFESFNKNEFKSHGITIEIAQANQSGSKINSLRGLHYQIVNSQGKLVRVLKGQIYDVAVDIRKSSSTFGKWQAVILNDKNRHLFWVPSGFAHGFYVMSDWAEVEYFTTDFYTPNAERTIIWNDPDIDIEWPLNAGETPTLSRKDLIGKTLKEADLYD